MSSMKGFLNFVREQGVVGLAVGFLLGGAVSKLVTAFISDIVNPLISLLFGFTGELRDASLQVGNSELMWGNFLSTMIDFIVIALVVYFGVHILGLDKIDKPKEKKKDK